MGRLAAFFDLDKTILATSSTLAFGRPFLDSGLITRRAALRAAYARLVYVVAGADEGQMDRMRDYVTTLCTGWDVATVRTIVQEALHETVHPLIYTEAAALIGRHKAAGHDVIIVSSSGEEVVGPIGEMLGVDLVIASRMVVFDGRYTGEVAFYAYGENKAAAVRALAARERYDLAHCFAYSDSVTDLPFLAAVGHPTAVNPDRALRRVAAERHWPVLDFDRPPSSRGRLGLPDPRLVTAVAGALAVGVTWYAQHRVRSRRRRFPRIPWV